MIIPCFTELNEGYSISRLVTAINNGDVLCILYIYILYQLHQYNPRLYENPGQNATGQNATKRKPDKMPLNKNASKL